MHMIGKRTLGSPLWEICTMGSEREDEYKRLCSLGDGTGSKESDYSEAPQRTPVSRLVPTHQSAVRVSSPWFIAEMGFDEPPRRLSIRVNFQFGSRFTVPGQSGEHSVHDTVAKTYLHVNLLQLQCNLKVRVPRVYVPEGTVVQASRPWAGKVPGFSLLFKFSVLLMSRQMPFSGVSRVTGESVHRGIAVCQCYVEATVATADLSAGPHLAIDETSRAKDHEYVSLFAEADPDPEMGWVLFMTKRRGAKTGGPFAQNLRGHHNKPSEIASVYIDMSPGFITGMQEHFPAAQITFDRFHVTAHASSAIDASRRLEQKPGPGVKEMHGPLLNARSRPLSAQRAMLDELRVRLTSPRTARAWQRRQQRRDILSRKQPNVVRSNIKPMKEVGSMIRKHFESILAWVDTFLTHCLLDTINGLFQAVSREASGYSRFRTIRTAIFLIARKLYFCRTNRYVTA